MSGASTTAKALHGMRVNRKHLAATRSDSAPLSRCRDNQFLGVCGPTYESTRLSTEQRRVASEWRTRATERLALVALTDHGRRAKEETAGQGIDFGGGTVRQMAAGRVVLPLEIPSGA